MKEVSDLVELADSLVGQSVVVVAASIDLVRASAILGG